MIELKNVSFSRKGKVILSDFSLSVNDGECVCLFGPSGCGKTTVLRLILGLEAPDSGEITAPDRLSYVFQEDRLVPTLTALRNVTVCLRGNQKKRAASLLKESGLESAADMKPSQLSGGMKRRLSIVRAAAFGGDALLLDEPFNGLDSETKAEMAKMIRREFCDKGRTVIMVSHIPEDAQIMNAETIILE